uniref:Uncharacterized protein n=1 Tax=Arundo donax TaxID=35708 RepID=A0A0A9I2R8_ARUDO
MCCTMYQDIVKCNWIPYALEIYVLFHSTILMHWLLFSLVVLTIFSMVEEYRT